MKTLVRVPRPLFPSVVLLSLLCATPFYCQAQQATPESDWPPLDTYASKAPVLLEVINSHFTVGRQYKSLFLRVFADRTAQCRYLRYGVEGEKDREKTKLLTTTDYESLKHILDDPELLKVNEKYGLVGWVIDSWETWGISIPHPNSVQHIAVDNFASGAVLTPDKPYPSSLTRLGCTIWKLRREVYGAYPASDTSEAERACKRFMGRTE
jgi:hypothetical protein